MRRLGGGPLLLQSSSSKYSTTTLPQYTTNNGTIASRSSSSAACPSLCLSKRMVLLLLCIIGYAGNIVLQWYHHQYQSSSALLLLNNGSEDGLPLPNNNNNNENPTITTTSVLSSTVSSLITTLSPPVTTDSTTTLTAPPIKQPGTETEIVLPKDQIKMNELSNFASSSSSSSSLSEKNSILHRALNNKEPNHNNGNDLRSSSSSSQQQQQQQQPVVTTTDAPLNGKIQSWLAPDVGKRTNREETIQGTIDSAPSIPNASTSTSEGPKTSIIGSNVENTSPGAEQEKLPITTTETSNVKPLTPPSVTTTNPQSSQAENSVNPLPILEQVPLKIIVSESTSPVVGNPPDSVLSPSLSLPNPPLPPPSITDTDSGILYILPNTEIKNCDIMDNEIAYNQRYQEVYDLLELSPKTTNYPLPYSPTWCVGPADQTVFYADHGASLALTDAINNHHTVSTKGIWNGQVPNTLKFPTEDFVPLNRWQPTLAPSITNLQIPVWDADRIKLLEQYQKGTFTQQSFIDLPTKGNQLKTLLSEIQTLRTNEVVLRKKATVSGATCALHVFAITNTYYTYVCEFLRSAILNGIVPHIVGFAPTTDGPSLYNWGLGKPLLWLRPSIDALITTVGPRTVVMLADAHDTMFTVTGENIIARFRYIQSKRPGMKILVTAERSCFPISEEECNNFPLPDLCSPYRNLNSGGWIGEAQDVLAVLDWVDTMYPQGLEIAIMNDQAALQYAYMNETSRRLLGLALDYTNQIFMALHLSETEVTIMKEDQTSWRHCNRVTGGCPALLHYNGGSKPFQPPHDTKLRTSILTVTGEDTHGLKKNITTYLDNYIIGGINSSVRDFCCNPAWTDPNQGNKVRADWLGC